MTEREQLERLLSEVFEACRKDFAGRTDKEVAYLVTPNEDALASDPFTVRIVCMSRDEFYRNLKKEKAPLGAGLVEVAFQNVNGCSVWELEV